MVDESLPKKSPPYDQANKAFDQAPNRFRNTHSGLEFEEASGVLFEQAMSQTRMAICLSDPNLPDAPIVFANRAFVELTGYPEDEIIGRNCRFLQGADTDPESVRRIRHTLESRDVTVVEILNYRKNGEKFWNALHLGPIYDAKGDLLYYFGSQWDVTEVKAARAEERHAKILARELSHRIKNMFSVISGVVTLTGRTYGGTEVANRINERIQALGRAHEATFDEAASGNSDIEPAVRGVLMPYSDDGERISFGGTAVRARASVVSTLGLVLNELATNAVKYGALSAPGGHIDVSWSQEGDDLVLDWTETGGPRVAEPKAGLGTSIVDMLLASIDSELHRNWRTEGLHATLRMRVEDDQ